MMHPLIRAATELAVAGVFAVAAATSATITTANYGRGQSGDLPLVNVTMVALLLLLPLTHGFTTLILPPRRRPVEGRAAAPVVEPSRSPGARVPASLPGWCEAGTPPTPSRLPSGWATRPVTAGRPPRVVCLPTPAGRAPIHGGVR